MKRLTWRTLAVFVVLLACQAPAEDAASVPEDSSVKKVVSVMQELKTEVQADMAAEASSYQNYSQWCKSTVKSSTAEISAAKDFIDEKARTVEQRSAAKAAADAEISNSEKLLAENKQSQAEAAALRSKELKAFTASKADLEESIASMRDALATLGQADTGESGTKFLALKEGSSRRAAASVHRLLQKSAVAGKLPAQDLELLSSFAQQASKHSLEPDESQPGQVLGVITQTKSDFEEDLKTSMEEEKSKAETHASLMTTMVKEMSGLQSFLTEQKVLSATAAKELSDSKILRDEREAQMKAETKLLDNTQDSCKTKAADFESRSKLRQQELSGITKAIDLLSSDASKQTFQHSHAAVLLSKSLRGASRSDSDNLQANSQEKIYESLKALAKKYHSLNLASLASLLDEGHFDKVLDSIDKQIEHLHHEDKQDIQHRDKCLKQLAESSEDMASLQDSLEKAGTKISSLEGKEQEMKTDLDSVVQEINETQTEMDQLGKEREEERKEHLESLKHDKDAVALIGEAIASMTNFYTENKVDISALQTGKASPAPDAGFDSANYEGSKGATNTVVTMLKMVKEDMEAEIKSAKAEDAASQEQYEKDYKAMKELSMTQESSEISLRKAFSELQVEIQNQKESKEGKEAEKSAQEGTKASLDDNCGWIKTNFDSRRQKRKEEIAGLVEAKGLLSA